MTTMQRTSPSPPLGNSPIPAVGPTWQRTEQRQTKITINIVPIIFHSFFRPDFVVLQRGVPNPQVLNGDSTIEEKGQLCL